MFDKETMKELRPDIWQIDPAEFFRVLPDLSVEELRWIIRSIAAYSSGPSAQTVSNWSQQTFDKELEDLSKLQLTILATRLKAVVETRHELLSE